ncbi:hypothetical protein [Deinococcus budaensis]|uniref:DUF4168 domain-containing protein n=1 Tax=Deinococcus budaensis TaxID=1665626 RepID=A0A7W8LNF6_9DEIO|nr:hypothetical protein [Deinococcus budaensis]MBB5232671.1 hypothetical protein [Deinococcus budaensis]
MKLKAWAAALGLFAGGMVLGQAFQGDIGQMRDVTPAAAVSTAETVYAEYVTLSLNAKSAAQISQIADEARVRMDLIQVKQNAEIIRQLTLFNSKK